MRYGFVFPGQGAQKVGMGLDLFNQEPEVKSLFQLADQILGRNLSEICFNGPEEELKATINAQPGIFLVSAAILKLLEKKQIQPTVVAGHSLGEITAYYAAKVFDLTTALKTIQERGQAMAQSFAQDQSAMAAIIGLDADTIAAVLQAENFSQYPVVIANYNTPEQTVISGEKNGVLKFSELIKTKGAKVIPLNVSGAFHSPLMERGADLFKEKLGGFNFQDSIIPIILNRTAEPETKAAVLKENLYLQIRSSVKWTQTILKMQDQVDVIIECGPGRVLAGLIKKIAPQITVKNVFDLNSLENI